MKWCIFLEFNRRRDLWEFFCYGPRGHMNTWLVLSKLMGIARRGDLKELEVCDFDKTFVIDNTPSGADCRTQLHAYSFITMSYHSIVHMCYFIIAIAI